MFFGPGGSGSRNLQKVPERCRKVWSVHSGSAASRLVPYFPNSQRTSIGQGRGKGWFRRVGLLKNKFVEKQVGVRSEAAVCRISTEAKRHVFASAIVIASVDRLSLFHSLDSR